MKLNNILTILVIFGTTAASGFTGYYILSEINREATFNVTKVIDGDTIEIETGQIVRLVGINSPEENEHFYKEAKEKLSELVYGKNVRLETALDDEDIYGRILRYVFVDDAFVNLDMIKEGYATVYIVDPEEEHYLEFKKAEKEAKDRNVGLWNPSAFSACIQITEFQYKGEEHVRLANNCKESIKMDGWEIKDEATHIYKFKSFTLNSGSSFTLFTGYGSDSTDKLYWNSKSTIWNNDGDTLFLRDDKGSLVLSYTYP